MITCNCIEMGNNDRNMYVLCLGGRLMYVN
jgi:hypothetical protein